MKISEISNDRLALLAAGASFDLTLLIALLLCSEKEGNMERRRVEKALGITKQQREEMLQAIKRDAGMAGGASVH